MKQKRLKGALASCCRHGIGSLPALQLPSEPFEAPWPRWQPRSRTIVPFTDGVFNPSIPARLERAASAVLSEIKRGHTGRGEGEQGAD